MRVDEVGSRDPVPMTPSNDLFSPLNTRPKRPQKTTSNKFYFRNDLPKQRVQNDVFLLVCSYPARSPHGVSVLSSLVPGWLAGHLQRDPLARGSDLFT